MQDFGSHGHPEQMVPWGEGECSPTDPTDHGGWYIWPNSTSKNYNSSIVGQSSLILSSDPLTTQFNDGSDPEAYAIFGVGTRVSATVWPWSYNTLCKITANDTGLTVTRPVQKYITPDFKYKWGWATASHTDGVFRIFATQGQSLYIAKVGWDEIEDTSKVSS